MEKELSGKYGRGKTVQLSPEDFDRLKGKKACCISSGYVMVFEGKVQYLHRWVFGLERGDKRCVDHIDGNKLNCMRENLRVCTTSENMTNRKKIGKDGITKSMYKGVTQPKGSVKWIASCKKDHVFYRLGQFDTEKEAALAYNSKVLELHKSFATLNVIKD
jgi:hypothetical protein